MGEILITTLNLRSVSIRLKKVPNESSYHLLMETYDTDTTLKAAPEDSAGDGADAGAAPPAAPLVPPPLDSPSRGRFLDAGASLASPVSLSGAGIVPDSAAVFSAFEASTLSSAFCVSQGTNMARLIC